MPSSSRTVSTELRAEIAQLRELVQTVIREVLRVSQTQAETGRQLTEAFSAMLQATRVDGPGSSRTISEELEYQQWREELRSRRG